MVHKIVCVIGDWPENADVFPAKQVTAGNTSAFSDQSQIPAIACLAGNTSASAAYQRDYFGVTFMTLYLNLLFISYLVRFSD